MASCEETRSLQIILNALKESVAPAPFRLLVKVLKHAIVQQINFGDISTGHLKLKEFNFRAVDCQTSKCRELLTMLGFKPCTMEEGICHEMVLHDVRRNMPYLEAFRDFATEELARTTCPNVEELKNISSVPLLVAHLACNYHLRFQHFLLVTHEDLMPVLQEDIHTASECVEYLASRLGVMLPGSDCRSSWNSLKQLASNCQSMPVFQGELDDRFVKNARELATELAMKLSWPVVDVFVRLFTFQRTAGIVGSGVMPEGDNLTNYLDSSEAIASLCPSDQFLNSVATCRSLMLKSFDCTLTPSEMYKLAQEVIWQTRNFIYHFQPDLLPYSECLSIADHASELGLELQRDTESHELPCRIDGQEIDDDDDDDDAALLSSQLVSVVDCSTVPESISSIRDTMIALRQSVALHPWRLYLKFLHLVVSKHRNGSPGTTVSINPYELNMCAVYFDSELGPRLMHQIGYKNLGENRVARFQLVMFNVNQHREQLAAFQQLAEEELASTSCPGIEQLQQIDSVPLWVAHLSYNYHVRVGLLIMTTSLRNLEVVAEDIHSGLECCEYIFAKLNIMASDRRCRQHWHETKQAVISYMENRVPSFMEELKGHFSEATSQVARELSRSVSQRLVAIFNYIYAVQLAAGICLSGRMLSAQNVARYLDSFDDMPGACMSQRYMESVEKIRAIMLRSFDMALPRVDVLKVGEIAVWQSGNFIYHFQSQFVDGSQPNPLIQERLAIGRPTVINNNEMSSGDEEEKVDVSEKTYQEKWVENDCNSNSQLADNCSSQPATDLSIETLRLGLDATSSRDNIAKRKASICSLISNTLSQQRVLERELEDLRSTVLHSSELPNIICQTLEEALKEKTSDYDVTTVQLSELEQMLAHAQRLLQNSCVSLPGLGCDLSKMLRDTLCYKRASLDIVLMIHDVVHWLSKEEVRSIGCALGASLDESMLDVIRLLEKTVSVATNVL